MNNFNAPSRRFTKDEKSLLYMLIANYGPEYGQRHLAAMIGNVSTVFSTYAQDSIRKVGLNNRTWASIYGRLRRQWSKTINKYGTDQMPVSDVSKVVSSV